MNVFKYTQRGICPGYILEKQLYLILDELDKMEKNSNPLAMKLSDLPELYRRL